MALPFIITNRLHWRGWFEIYPSASIAESVWDKLIATGAASGLKPAGLGSKGHLAVSRWGIFYMDMILMKDNAFRSGAWSFCFI